ncbi:MAG: hypothetical protein WCE23_16745, partial [Candidatus Binatus sp.]|uniref:hypothetical protein n=1 Tax=Candidatus Binatus sp. TaxID=2811406 RepID=UPI003C741378
INSGENTMFKNPLKNTDSVAANAVKKEVEIKSTPKTEAKVEPAKKIDLNKPSIKEAIAQGKAIIKDGKSKADAARAIYALTKDEPKEIIVAAFVEGATLTPKGALTYWYNCKRRAAKESRVQNVS